jgi:hypothetical protein
MSVRSGNMQIAPNSNLTRKECPTLPFFIYTPLYIFIKLTSSTRVLTGVFFEVQLLTDVFFEVLSLTGVFFEVQLLTDIFFGLIIDWCLLLKSNY